jgi:uncharacterized membrane protein YgcG
MARPRQRNLVTRLADAGEEAIQRLSDAPGADRLLGAVNTMRDRMDEMQKKFVGLEAVERRLTEIERRLDKLEGKAATTRRRTSPTSRSRQGSSATGGGSAAGSGSGAGSSGSGGSPGSSG